MARTSGSLGGMAVLVALLGSIAASLWVEWLWFDSLQLGRVFLVLLGARLATGAVAATLCAAVVGGSVATAMRLTANRPVLPRVARQGAGLAGRLRRPGALPDAARQAVVWAATLAFAAGALLAHTVLPWWTSTPFGTREPILGHDLGFYVFTVPVLHLVGTLLLLSLLVGLALSAVVLSLRGALTVQEPDVTAGRPAWVVRADRGARRLLATQAAAVAVVLAAGLLLDRYDALLATPLQPGGPTYTTVHVTLPMLLVRTAVGLVAAGMVFRGLDRLSGPTALGALTLVLAAAGLHHGAEALVQRLVVVPNQLELEDPYLRAHVTQTRLAWGLDGVEERALPGDDALDAATLDAHRDTLEGIRLWDHEVLLESLRQLQEIRTYYEFLDVDDDRYVVDGRLRQTLLAPREMQADSLPPEALTWTSERLVYTHGHGLVLSPANAVTDQGLPELWVYDVPPQLTHPDALRVDAPQLYFGEATTEHVLVQTRRPELDYPTPTGEAVTSYAGRDGIEVGGLAHRIVLAFVLRELDLLTSAELVPTSRVLLHRQVVERARKVAPFLAIDPDPTLVVADGRLVWIVDGYTHTESWPLAAHAMLRTGRRGVPATALRNPVKLTVDATDGTVAAYQVAPDPLLEPWVRALPGLVQPLDAMPAALRAHIQVPEDLFALQADLLTTYHMTEPREFFTREDAWDVPEATRQVRADGKAFSDEGPMRPYHVVLTLPGETEPEFVAMLPLTPAGKKNLTAWLVARSDGEAYGTLRVYRFPRDRLVYGPAQVAARIRQDDDISEKITLWSQQGSRVVLGTLQVIPVGDALLYVQPLYLRADADGIPELTRVIVAHADRVEMARTLEEAVEALVGGGREPAPPASAEERAARPPATQAELEAARQAWAEVREAMERGDWAAVGERLGRLGEALEGSGALP